jgi:hypothetical protein
MYLSHLCHFMSFILWYSLTSPENDFVSEIPEGGGIKRFGKDVSFLVFGVNLLQYDVPSVNSVSEVVVFNVDMFSSGAHFG